MGNLMGRYLPWLYLLVVCSLVVAITFGVFGCTRAYVDGVGQIRDSNGNKLYPPLFYNRVDTPTKN